MAKFVLYVADVDYPEQITKNTSICTIQQLRNFMVFIFANFFAHEVY